MKRMLLVLTMVLVGSLAANAKVVTLDFDGFCDGIDAVRFSPGAPIPMVWLKGVHEFVTGCGFPFNVPVSGFKHGNNMFNPPFVAPVDDFSDPSESVLFALPYSLQYLVHEPNAVAGCVWANFFGNGSGMYLILTGTCTFPTQAQHKRAHTGRSTLQR